MRIALACVAQETCSFTPIRTTLDDFRQYGLYEGNEILEKASHVGGLAGFFAAAREMDFEFESVPTIYGWAGAGGLITADALAFFKEKLVTGLQNAGDVDALFFDMHGAASAEGHLDLEGYLLAVAREILGPDVPIVSPLDHHGNITQLMIDSLDGLVGHRTQPHDPADTGYYAGKLLFQILRGEITPTMAWRKIPLITHQEQYLTKAGPMKEWFDLAREMETRPGVVSVSPFPMQCWLDVPEGGWSAVVITDDDQALAEKLARELAAKAWSLREDFWVMDSVSPEEAVKRALDAEKGVVLLSDTGDSVFGGAAGDSTIILKEMLRQEITQTALVPMVDAEAVAACIEAGLGNEVTVAIGGKLDNVFSSPATVTGTVAAIGGGWIETEVIGLDSFDMGRAVLLEVGAIKIALSENRGVGGNHPIVYRHFGVEPAEAKMVVMKTASNFQYYADMTSDIIRVDTLGGTTSHLEAFDWKCQPRPVYPLDELENWQPA